MIGTGSRHTGYGSIEIDVLCRFLSLGGIGGLGD